MKKNQKNQKQIKNQKNKNQNIYNQFQLKGTIEKNKKFH